MKFGRCLTSQASLVVGCLFEGDHVLRFPQNQSPLPGICFTVEPLQNIEEQLLKKFKDYLLNSHLKCISMEYISQNIIQIEFKGESYSFYLAKAHLEANDIGKTISVFPDILRNLSSHTPRKDFLKMWQYFMGVDSEKIYALEKKDLEKLNF